MTRQRRSPRQPVETLEGRAMLSAAAAPAAGIETYNGHTYAVIGREGISWHDGEAQARQTGGHLVTINDAAENDFLVGFLRRAFGRDQEAWTGLTDDPQYGGHEAGNTSVNPYPPEGNRGEGWVWVSGEPVTYQNWAVAQPDNAQFPGMPGQSYGTIDYHAVEEPGKWDDSNGLAEVFGAVYAAVVEMPSAQPPAGPTYEAESASITGAVVAKNHAGYKGGGFVDFLNAGGDAVQFTVQAPSAGWYDLSFRYANGGASDRRMALSVNAQSVSGGISFARTGSWTQWRSAVATVQLNEGVNTVRLAASGQSGPNLDSLTLRPSQSPTEGTYQAESAVLKGVIVAPNNSGFTGSGYADYQHASGDYVEFAIDVPAGGTRSLDFRYANGGKSDRPLELKVDGNVVTGRLSFGPTRAWSNWTTVSQPITLAAGRHTVRLTATGKSGPNLDSLAVLPAGQGVNLVRNGGFEQGPPQSSFSDYPWFHLVRSGSPDLTDWRVGQGSVEIVQPFWTPSQGARSLDLDGLNAGAIEQDLPTVAGHTYEVSFDLSGNFDGPYAKSLRVSAAGDAADFTLDRPPGWSMSDMQWSRRTWRFVAKSTNTTLRFESLDADDSIFGPALDAISVVDVGR